MSAICEAFGCTPAEAVRQDWALVQAVLDYRNARVALELLNAVSSGDGATSEAARRRLEENPGLGTLMIELHRAQQEG